MKNVVRVIAALFLFNIAVAHAQNAKGVSRFDVKMTAAQEAAIPDVSGGLPVLAGTTWAVISIYQKGTTPKTQFRPGNYLFCKNGKWEHQTGTLQLSGTYKVRGNNLTTDDGPGTKASEWKISWDGSVKEMEMEQGNSMFVLRARNKMNSTVPNETPTDEATA
jgi:hypothetical protein